jgi:hypothetical protein
MSDKPIVVSTKPLQLSGTVRGPIVVTQQEGDSGDTTPRLGYNQPTYKVKLVANGKTFNMLLPPSIESKHPGRSNPLQLPGLQIKANINISKLKIPGFFPIYQNLGVESLTISMSGMFTGYDGTNLLSAANWENSVGIGQSNVEQGQDSFTSASELYDFAVNNKALVQVTIYTSDGSFIPKKSTSTAFRDNNSNISFKGYIKEFEQVYIRQDRNYYLLRFEIVDFGSAKCKAVVSKTNNTLLNKITSSAYGINDPSITAEDIAYLSPEDLERAKTLINKINKGEKITNKDLDGITSISTMAQIAIYANSKGQNTDDLYAYILNKTPTGIIEKEYLANPEREKYLANKFETNITLICNYLKNDCKSQKEVITKNKEVISKGINNSSNNSNSKTPEPVIPITPSLPPEQKTQAQIIISSNMYNKRFTDKYITNQRILINTNQANRDFKISPEFNSSIYVSYKGNKKINDKYYPILNIRNFETGIDIGNYIATPYNSISVKLERF